MKISFDCRIDNQKLASDKAFFVLKPFDSGIRIQDFGVEDQQNRKLAKAETASDQKTTSGDHY